MRTSRGRRRIILVLLNCIAITVAIRVFLPPQPDYVALQRGQQLADLWKTEPIAAADYYSPEFVKDYQNVPGPIPGEYGITQPDYSSRYINVQNGYRRTIGQPTHWTHTVWVFGDSVAFGVEVPDVDTLASNLQKLTDYRVINAARTGAVPSVTLTVMQGEPVKPGDIIVWYTEDPDLFQRYVGLYEPISQTVEEARSWSTQHGADFYGFQWPYLLSMPVASDEQIFIEIGGSMCVLNPQHQANHALIDLTHILDSSRRAGQRFYFDCDHTNDRAYSIAAWAIYQYLDFEF